MKFEKSVSVLLPVCNEVQTIESVIREWVVTLRALPANGSRIIVEDGNSDDGTCELLEKLSNEYPEILKVLFHPARDGFKNALHRLFEQAESDYVFVADTDGQYMVSDFFFFLERASAGAKFVKGVKINRRDGLPRRFFSYLMNRFIVIFIGLPFIDYNSSHYMIDTFSLRKILNSKLTFKYSINTEVTLKALISNIDYSIVYVKHQSRSEGISRGNPPLKFLGYGLTTMKEIWNLKKNF